MANEVRLIFGAATDVGRVRDVNEDAHGLVRCRWGDLLVVCDGMGGHAAGDVASQTARDAILGHALASQAPDATTMLRDALIRGHNAIHDVVSATIGREGMGTTAVLALVRAGHVHVANVGDSRCYLVRGGTAQLLSKDHTKAQKLFDQGLIDATQFASHPERGVLSQALGQRAMPEPHLAEPIQLRADDVLVLCTDGAYESMLTDLGPLVARAKNPNYAAHDLVAQAVERDGKDNATAIVARWDALVPAASSVSPGPRVVPPTIARDLPTAGSGMTWLRPRNVLVGAIVVAIVAAAAGSVLMPRCDECIASGAQASRIPGSSDGKAADGGGRRVGPMVGESNAEAESEEPKQPDASAFELAKRHNEAKSNAKGSPSSRGPNGPKPPHSEGNSRTAPAPASSGETGKGANADPEKPKASRPDAAPQEGPRQPSTSETDASSGTPSGGPERGDTRSTDAASGPPVAPAAPPAAAAKVPVKKK